MHHKNGENIKLPFAKYESNHSRDQENEAENFKNSWIMIQK